MILKGSLPQSRSQFLPAQISRTYYAAGERSGKQIRRSPPGLFQYAPGRRSQFHLGRCGLRPEDLYCHGRRTGKNHEVRVVPLFPPAAKVGGVFISGFHLHPKPGAFGRLALIHFSVFNRLTSTPSRHTSSENSWCPQKSRIASSVLASSSFGGSVRKLAMISASRSWLKISSC